METALIVLDGWGLGSGAGGGDGADGETADPSGRPAGRDAVAAADTPAIDDATEWLLANVNASAEPVRRGWDE